MEHSSVYGLHFTMSRFQTNFCLKKRFYFTNIAPATTVLILGGVFFISLAVWSFNMQFIGGFDTKLWNKQSQFIEKPYQLTCDSSTVNWDQLLASETLTGSQLLQYFSWPNRSSCQLFHNFGGVMMSDPSGLDGQKAVCIDPVAAPQPGNCLVYSFGIDNEWSFDENMALYGCEVYAFDPSMGMNQHDHNPGNIHFYNWALGSRNEFDQKLNRTIRSLSFIYETLSTVHGNRIIDYLKMDVEFSEWIALPDIIATGMLSNIRQLGMEVHLDGTYSLEQLLEWAKILRSVEKMGMVRFDSEYNPWFMGNFTQFSLTGSFGYEIAWYNSKLLHSLPKENNDQI